MIESGSRELYLLLASRGNLPLFHMPWWLDATAGPANWDVATVVRGGEVVAALPYMRKHRFGLRVLSLPPLSPYLGPWFADAGGKPSTRLAREKELTAALISALPRHDSFRQSFHPSITNWLPWYWAGFSQFTRYTYVLDTLGDEHALWSGLSESARREIRKARDREGIVVTADLELDVFLDVNRRTFARQRRAVPYTDDLVRRIDAACGARGCRRIMAATDGAGQVHAVAYLVWDAERTYYLMGGGDPDLRTSGASSLLMWEGIRFAAGVSRQFDFEGSMIEPVERFFRGFGARQEPYLFLWRHPGLLAALYEAWRTVRER